MKPFTKSPTSTLDDEINYYINELHKELGDVFTHKLEDCFRYVATQYHDQPLSMGSMGSPDPVPL